MERRDMYFFGDRRGSSRQVSIRASLSDLGEEKSGDGKKKRLVGMKKRKNGSGETVK